MISAGTTAGFGPQSATLVIRTSAVTPTPSMIVDDSWFIYIYILLPFTWQCVDNGDYSSYHNLLLVVSLVTDANFMYFFSL